MEIICSQCKARLSVADEKIPKDTDITLTCPKCSGRIIIECNNENNSEDLLNFLNKNQVFLVDENKSEDFILHHNYDIPIALLLCSSSDNHEFLGKVVSDLGFRSHATETERNAASMILLNDFNLIVMCEEFCKGYAFFDSPVLKQIRIMKPSSRRKCFVVLIGKDLITNDRIKAFVLNANLVVNSKDVANISTILNSALKENERFYSLFMLERGKDYSA